MEFKDYYKILGVDRGADQKSLSTAYRKLARQHHPDVNKAKGAEDRFKEINEAYQVLGDPQRRARYDQMYEAYQHGGADWQQLFGRGGGTQAPGGWTVTFGGDAADVEDLLGGFGFSDFFKQFFGGDLAGARPPSDRRRARPGAEATMTISLQEAFAGGRKPVSVRLNGASQRFDVTIPQGVQDGQRIRLPGALDGGDLYLTVRIEPHPYFERRGDDILIDIPVTVAEAVLGATIEVPALDGKIEMTVPPGTQNGRTFRLRGQGMPRRDGGRGDQLVRISVVLPEKPSARERQLVDELGKLSKENPRARFGCK